MHLWQVEMEGPADTPYAVRSTSSDFIIFSALTYGTLGRSIHSQCQPPQRLPFQAPRSQLRDSHLPPQRYLR